MTCIWMDGFDEYTSASDLSQNYPNANVNFGENYGRFGGGGIQPNGQLLYTLPENETELWIGFAFNLNNNSPSGPIVAFISSNGTECSLYYDSQTGVMSVTAASTLGSATVNIQNNAWHWIDIDYVISSSEGSLIVWIDNVRVINITGADTTNHGSSSFSSVSFFYNPDNGNKFYCAADDIVINNTSGSYNNGRQGDSRILTVVPTSDIGPSDGTPESGASNYGAVDEAQWSSSNYLTYTNTNGQASLFGMGSLSETPTAVDAIRVYAIAEKSDSGAATAMTYIVSDGTTENGTSEPLLTSYSQISSIFEYDPNTNAAWTVSGVNAVHCGFEVTTS